MEITNEIMDFCPDNQLPEKKTIYTHVVYSTGLDCDCFASDEEYYFQSDFEAYLFADECNDNSDGLKYIVSTIEEYENF